MEVKREGNGRGDVFLCTIQGGRESKREREREREKERGRERKGGRVDRVRREKSDEGRERGKTQDSKKSTCSPHTLINGRLITIFKMYWPLCSN